MHILPLIIIGLAGLGSSQATTCSTSHSNYYVEAQQWISQQTIAEILSSVTGSTSSNADSFTALYQGLLTQLGLADSSDWKLAFEHAWDRIFSSATATCLKLPEQTVSQSTIGVAQIALTRLLQSSSSSLSAIQSKFGELLCYEGLTNKEDFDLGSFLLNALANAQSKIFGLVQKSYTLGFVIDTNALLAPTVNIVRALLVSYLNGLNKAPTHYILASFNLAGETAKMYDASEKLQFLTDLSLLALNGGPVCSQPGMISISHALELSSQDGQLFVITGTHALDSGKTQDVIAKANKLNVNIHCLFVTSMFCSTDLKFYKQVQTATKGFTFSETTGFSTVVKIFEEHRIAFNDPTGSMISGSCTEISVPSLSESLTILINPLLVGVPNVGQILQPNGYIVSTAIYSIPSTFVRNSPQSGVWKVCIAGAQVHYTQIIPFDIAAKFIHHDKTTGVYFAEREPPSTRAEVTVLLYTGQLNMLSTQSQAHKIKVANVEGTTSFDVPLSLCASFLEGKYTQPSVEYHLYYEGQDKAGSALVVDLGVLAAGPSTLACSPSCLNGGTCDADNNCLCQQGFTGSGCSSQASCDPVCGSGTCTENNVCTCNFGYAGATCNAVESTIPCVWNICRNGGTCTVSNVDGSTICACRPGYQGDTCEMLIVCSPECANGGICIATDQCSCTAQWSGSTCESDVNECDTENGGCEQDCNNTPGTRTCHCFEGYYLNMDGVTCIDVDECASTENETRHDCDHTCTNNVGSFNCSCSFGYNLKGRTTCEDIDECTVPPPGLKEACNQTCENTPGDYVCTCRDGYLLEGKRTCVDVNECDDNPKPCQQICLNNVGSFTCDCDNGYSKSGKTTCEDIDECSTDNGGCSQTCSNQIGSYQCSCRSGFILQPDRASCEKFNPFDPPKIMPVDDSFIGVIQNYMLGGCEDSLCACAASMLSQLEMKSIGALDGSYSLDMFRTNLKPAGDLMYAVFGEDTTLALPFAADLKQISFDCDTSELSATTFETEEVLQYFPNIVTMLKPFLTFRISFAMQLEPTLLYLGVTGELNLGGHKFTVTVDLSSHIWKIDSLTVLADSINLHEFSSSAFERPLTLPAEIAMLSGVSLRGAIDTVNEYQLLLVFVGSIQISDWFTNDAHFLVSHSLDRVGLSNPQVLLFTGCSSPYNIGFGGLLDRISTQTSDSLAFFNNLQLKDVHISYVTEDFFIASSALQPLLEPQQSCIVTNPDPGLRYHFDIVLGTPTYQWVIEHNGDQVVFIPQQPAATFLEMLAEVTENTITPTHDMLNDIDIGSLRNWQINLDLTKKKCNFSVNLPQDKTLEIWTKLIRLTEMTLHYEANLDGALTFNKVILSGTVPFLTLRFDMEVATNDEDQNLIATACATDQNLLSGSRAITAALNNNEGVDSIMLSALDVFDIGIINPCIEVVFESRRGNSPQTLCISTDLIRSKYAKVSLAACIDVKFIYYLGFEVTGISLSQPVSKSLEGAANQSPFMTSPANLAIVYIPGNSIHMFVPPLKGQGFDDLVAHRGAILGGTTFYAKTGWPNSCLTDSFCKILYEALGPDINFFLFAYIDADFKTLRIEAGIKNFKLGDIDMANVKLFLLFKRGEKLQVTIGIAAAVRLGLDPPNDDITLHGSVAVSLPDPKILLKFVMQGCWVEAFGIRILDICDILIGLQLSPESPLPTGASFGMRVRFGDPDCARVEALGYVRIDAKDKSNNWFYVSLKTPFTLQTIFDLLCTDVQLPSFLAESGLPKGFTLSYSMKADVIIPQLRIAFQQGLYFEGEVNFFGVVVSLSIATNFKTAFELEGTMTPLTLGDGLIKVYYSRSDKDNGPYLFISAASKPVPRFRAQANGYVSVFGIEAEISIEFSLAGMDLYFWGKIFDVLEVNVHIYSHTNSIYNAEFGIEANMTTNIMKKIEDAVVGIINAAGEVADAALSDVQGEFRNAQDGLDKVNAELRKEEENAEGAKRDLRKSSREITNLRRNRCKIKTCPKVCVPFLCGCGCEVRVWGACIVPCLYWDSCCFRIPELGCGLYNIACYIEHGLVEIAIKVVQVVLKIAEGLVSLYQLALKAVQVLVEIAKGVLELAILAVEAVKAVLKFAVQALEAITRFLLTGIINLRGMGFEAKLGVMSHGHIKAWADVSFFGSDPVHLSITIPIFNPLALADDLADEAIPGLGRKKRALSSRDKVQWLAKHFHKTGSIYPVKGKVVY